MEDTALAQRILPPATPTNEVRHVLALSLRKHFDIVIFDQLTEQTIRIGRVGGRKISITAPSGYSIEQEGTPRLDPACVRIGFYQLDHAVIVHRASQAQINIGGLRGQRKRDRIFICASARFCISREPITANQIMEDRV